MVSYGLDKFNSDSENPVILPTLCHSQPHRLYDNTASYTMGVGWTFPEWNRL